MDALSNHKWDQAYHQKNKKKRKQSKSDKNDQKKKDTEKKSDKNESSFAQKDAKTPVCYICGKVGHKLTKCPDKDKIAKKDWAITKMSAQAHSQNDDSKKLVFG